MTHTDDAGHGAYAAFSRALILLGPALNGRASGRVHQDAPPGSALAAPCAQLGRQLSAAHAVRQARTLLAQLRPRTSGTASNEASASQQQRALATCRPAVATLSPPRKIAHADQRPRASQNIAAQERQQDSVNAAAVSEETDTESDSDGVEVDPELAAWIWASMKRSLKPIRRKQCRAHGSRGRKKRPSQR